MRVLAVYSEDCRSKLSEWTKVADLFDAGTITVSEDVELELIIRLRDKKRPQGTILRYDIKAPSGEMIADGKGTLVVNLRAVLVVPADKDEEEEKNGD